MRWVAVVVLVGLGGTARADYVLVEPQPRDRKRGTPTVMYLNPCIAAPCSLRLDVDDADLNGSTIAFAAGPLTPFQYGEDAWAEVVACVRTMYALFGIEVTLDEPAAGSDYVEVMVAGSPFEIGRDGNVLGIAPLADDRSTQVNVIGLAFANNHNGNVAEICATAAHEAGHMFGLDHEFECKDDMTYLTGCGQKSFTNLEAACGEFDGPRECQCSGATQDSYKKLLAELGPGTLPGPPEVSIDAPDDGDAIVGGTNVFARTPENGRVIIRAELWINGWRWADQVGETVRTLYQIPLPIDVPDGVIDLEVRMVNDVGQVGTDSIRVTLGAPCTSPATCAAGQECDAEGRCVYPTPAGQLGEACTRDLDCASTRCLEYDANQICTANCMTDFDDQCPDDFTCLADSTGTSGACWPDALLPSSGGCCQTGAGGGGGGPAALLGLGTLAAILARRRS